ncbi:MAG: Regulator of chromosome condensation [Candidatus Uhrbacteria bacterium GW2011_GWA2_52_8d]|uniref:Regulator of chromosome condensation n=2 Tax=Candidatus Uhriibacteriota TaxID=1752732 RepID=A0A0G0UDU5_9BACT|nr:MAG: Regulator of chromosome condensation [Candidatus Uhrbacteria bacterium GW2011_GWC2_41_11]KKW32386.1 MAG: Regulator of chromosome condensation [Candidatus Uhrbacteria bacterium GW2011_GWA2_52_8d]HBP00472.1 hypothetical protein [Candidatus Uhrbacteria bacterium]
MWTRLGFSCLGLALLLVGCVPGTQYDERVIITDPAILASDDDGDGYNEEDDGDCNDANASVYPGAGEVCNEVDDDCDGVVDDGLNTTTWYLDWDSDGYGSNSEIHIDSCDSVHDGYVTVAGDCDDTNPVIHPNASEVANNHLDDDCDGLVDEVPYNDTDADGDGSLDQDDCAPNNQAIYPGAGEVCNGLDDDCDKSIDEGFFATYFLDSDGDGYGNEDGTPYGPCKPSIGVYVTNNLDCNDASASVHPGATETCDGEDEDCDGVADEGLTCADDSDPVDIRENLSWIDVQDNKVGLKYGYVFSSGTDVSEIAVTGEGIQGDWGYNANNRASYNSSTDFLWFSFDDGLYRVTWRTDGANSNQSTWAEYGSYCSSSSSDSVLCHTNTAEQEYGYSLCFVVDDGEVYQASVKDCDAI